MARSVTSHSDGGDRPDQPAAATAVTVALPRQLHAHQVEKLRDRLYKPLRDPSNHLVLDGANVEHITPAGICVLVAAALLAQQTGATIHLTRPSPALHRELRRYRHIAGLLAEPPPDANRGNGGNDGNGGAHGLPSGPASTRTRRPGAVSGAAGARRRR